MDLEQRFDCPELTVEGWLKVIEQKLSGLKYQPQRFLLNPEIIGTPKPSSKYQTLCD
jgi:hypothetical protein